MLGLPVPDDMEGRVIEGVFDPPVSITREAACAAPVGAETGAAYSEEDQRKITERLMDLGYLP